MARENGNLHLHDVCDVLNGAAWEKGRGQNQFYGPAVGFVIVSGAYGAGAGSGSYFNPAVAFGIDVSRALLGFGACVWYTYLELIGASVATVFFWVVRPDEEDAQPGLAMSGTANIHLSLSWSANSSERTCSRLPWN